MGPSHTYIQPRPSKLSSSIFPTFSNIFLHFFDPINSRSSKYIDDIPTFFPYLLFPKIILITFKLSSLITQTTAILRNSPPTDRSDFQYKYPNQSSYPHNISNHLHFLFTHLLLYFNYHTNHPALVHFHHGTGPAPLLFPFSISKISQI